MASFRFSWIMLLSVRSCSMKQCFTVCYLAVRCQPTQQDGLEGSNAVSDATFKLHGLQDPTLAQNSF